MTEKKLHESVLLVSCPADPTVALAFGTVLEDDCVRWFDLFKERAMTVRRVVTEDDDSFSFEREEDGPPRVYMMRPLTLEDYRREVMPKMLEPIDYETETEMLDALQAAAVL